MKCILCVKEFGTITNPHVLIYSTKGETLEARHVIEKHFWLKPDELDADRRLICRFCWKVVLSFHKFYIRIENVHKTLEQVEEESLFIKTEAEVVYCTSLINPLQDEETVDSLSTTIPQCNDISIEESESVSRGYGRLSRQSSNKEEFPEIPEKVQTTVDELIKEENENEDSPSKRKRGRPCKEEKLSSPDRMSFDIKIENEAAIEDIEEKSSEMKLDQTVKIQKKRGRPRKLNSQSGIVRKVSKVMAKREKIANKQSRKIKSQSRIVSNLNMVIAKDVENADKQLNLETSNENENASSTQSVTATSTSKVQKSMTEQQMKSLEINEMIAQNFKLVCCLCNLSISTFSKLKTHFRVEHKTLGYVRCCGKKIQKRNLLVDHIKWHQDPTYFKCTKCNKLMATRWSLELHMKKHEETRERNYQCEICEKRFFSHIVYLRHMELHKPEQERTHQCPQCSKTFVTEYNMKQHLRAIHLNTYTKVCDICGKTLRSSYTFYRHQQEHSGIRDPLVECKICGDKVSTKYALTRHIRLRHSAKYSQAQTCQICGRVSTNIETHRRHIQYVHVQERTHVCPMCPKAFKTKKDLREHLTTHTDEALYNCPHCTNTYKSNANMQAHRKRAHHTEWMESQRQRFLQQHRNKYATQVANDSCSVENSLPANDDVTTADVPMLITS